MLSSKEWKQTSETSVKIQSYNLQHMLVTKHYTLVLLDLQAYLYLLPKAMEISGKTDCLL